MNFSLGLVEVSALGNAIAMLDEMVKVANVEFEEQKLTDLVADVNKDSYGK